MIAGLREPSETLKQEFRGVVGLAGPLVLANLGWMSMGIVDTMMVGRVSAEAIGAVSLGNILFSTVAFLGGGLLLGLDALVPQAFGAGKIDDCHRSLLNSIYLSLPLALGLMSLVWMCIPFLGGFGIHPAVLRQTIPYLRALNWSTLPLLLYFGFRGYLQGMNLVKPVMFSVVSANLVNALGDWVLIFGHFGAPAMGAEGSGWSTCISRLYMSAVLIGYAVYYDSRRRTGLLETSFKPDLLRLGRLVGLGLPAALQITLELAVFAAATTLIAKLDPVSLAGHQVAMNVVSFTYMVPLGVGSAAAVRVGQALGRGDLSAARRSGWGALLLGASFMATAALAFLVGPRYIVRAFTPDAAVIKAGTSLLIVAAFFQLFDGLQVVATGALRGAGDTQTPMVCHFVAYWVLGLPLGYFLCFMKGWGAVGLWIGLCAALMVIGLVLLGAWHRKVGRLSDCTVDR